MSKRFGAFVVAILGMGLASGSCSSGPSGPRAGTPEWYWQAAGETFASGDYEKAQEHLGQVAASESENKGQATLWRAMLTGGLARGYMDLATILADAVDDNESLASDFTVRIQDYRRAARRHSITFTESVGALRKIAEEQPTVKLQFPFPDGSANEAPALVGLREGQKIPMTQIDAAVAPTLERGLILQTAEMAGAGKDAAKAKTMLQPGPAEVPSLVFQQALAKSLYDISALFSDKQLHEPKIQKVMLDSALRCLTPALEATDAAAKKQAEEFKKEIDKVAGKLKA
jgi:hypothetical protein